MTLVRSVARQSLPRIIRNTSNPNHLKRLDLTRLGANNGLGFALYQDLQCK